jgi:hypothetical protein
VDRPWDVPPDTGSILAINEVGARTVIYRNRLDGLPDDDGNGVPTT